MSIIEPKRLHKIERQDADGNKIEVELEIKYQLINVLPPIGKQKKHPGLRLTIIHVEEKDTPLNRDKIVWKLATNLPVNSTLEAIQKLDWYALRWRMENFHKILKSGCKAESSKFRTAQIITNLIAIFCILSWRVFWMTMISRHSPNASPELAFTNEEKMNKNLSPYIRKVARLGGYLARKSGPPTGNIVMW